MTGGSRGIGRATALLLARAGADVALPSTSRAAEAEAVAGEIRALGRRALAVGGDLADPAVVERMAASVAARSAGSTCFVANAGDLARGRGAARPRFRPTAGAPPWRPTWTPSISPPARRSV